MNTVVLRRRLFYISAMVALLVPLYFLGNPSVRNADGSIKESGGTLAQLRTKYDLGQSDLGELDPASESVRLATLGLRGPAITILWQQANYYKKEKYWDQFSATLNQIAVLQPHFIKIWEFQAHNMSYNVSVEFDDYRQRYQWVKKGINYLIEGGKYNKRRTELPYELGWFFGNKMGVADEKKQFRVLYADDKPFHDEVEELSGLDLRQKSGLGPNSKPDNWRGGSLWYQRAYDMVSQGSRPAKSPHMFYRMGPSWQMKHAEAIQADGYLESAARNAWTIAEDMWKDFGQRQIRTTFGDIIFMNELRLANQEVKRIRESLEEFAGDTFKQLKQDRMDTLSDVQRAALEKPDFERNFDELQIALQAESLAEVPPRELLAELPEDKQVDALKLVKQLEAEIEKVLHIEIYRNQINYAYWEARAIAEQEDEALAARRSMFDANQLLDEGKLDEAIAKFETAWVNWAKLFDMHPAMMIDDSADAVIDSIERYLLLLDQPDLPDDFALSDFLTFRELYQDKLADPQVMNSISEWPAKYPGRSFLADIMAQADDIRAEMNRPRGPIIDEGPGENGVRMTAPIPEPPNIRRPVSPEEAKSEGAKTEATKSEESKEKKD